jgi:ABC-type lipoprotein release transport system permease subunit
MFLTFLNLVFVNGLLVGLIEGSSAGYKDQYSSDVIITNLENKRFISKSQEIIRYLETLPQIDRFVPRYVEMGTIEANFQTRNRASDLPDSVGTELVGIDPIKEDNLTNLSSFILEGGSYLNPGEEGFVLIGSELLREFFPVEFSGFETLDNVKPGTKLRITVGDNMTEARVKGIVFTKISPTNRRVFFVESELRKLIGRSDGNVDEIAVMVKPGYTPEQVRDTIKAGGVSENALVRTSMESMGEFLTDIINTFGLLGTIVGTIGILVAAITVFIVVFINAISRRKFIGILKGIGIKPLAIEVSYMIQSLFYALIGTGIGLALLYGILKPYIDINPIDFPFSDGIIVAPVLGTMIRVTILLLITAIAGYIPARIIVKQNTLDAILGR